MAKLTGEKKIYIVIGIVFLVAIFVYLYAYHSGQSNPELLCSSPEEKEITREKTPEAPLSPLKVVEVVERGDERPAEVEEDAIYHGRPAIKEGAMEESLQLEDPPVHAIVDRALWDENEEIRFSAIKELGMIGDREAMEGLVSCLDDEKTRLKAAEELMALGKADPDAMEAIAAILYGPDPEVQIVLIGVLERAGIRESARVLLGVLEGPEEEVDQEAWDALRRMDRKVVTEAMEMVLEEEEDETIRSLARRVLEGKVAQ